MVKSWLWYLLYFVLYFVGLSVVWAYLVFGQAGQGLPHGLWTLISVAILLLFSGILGWAMNRLYRTLKPQSPQSWQWRLIELSVLYSIIMMLGVSGYQWLLEWLGHAQSTPENQQILINAFKYFPLLTSLYAIIIAPIMEEYLFRGLLFALLGKWLNNKVWMILITSLIFGLLHEPALNLDMLPYMGMGAVLGVCYWRTGQLRYSIVAHMMNNALSVLMIWWSVQAA